MSFESKSVSSTTFNSNLYATDAPQTVLALIQFRKFHDAGTVHFPDQPNPFQISHSFSSRTWILTAPQSPESLESPPPFAVAKQTSVIGRPMIISHGDRKFEFLPISRFRENYVVRTIIDDNAERSKPTNHDQIGLNNVVAIVHRIRSFKAKFTLSFDDSIPLQLRAFINWLCVMWYRRSAGSAGGAGAAAGAGAF